MQPQPSQTNPSPAGIVLAAGASRRMGAPKLLLPWQGEALIRHAARSALAGGLAPVIVVTGSQEDAIQSVLSDFSVQFVFNPDWERGQSTSVRAGVAALPEECPAAIFLLGDQPFVSPELIRALTTAFIETHAPILAPAVEGRRANPVLFSRSVFPDLLALQGDVGGRALFARYTPVLLPWPDERLLLDVDTPEDFERLGKI